MADLTVEYAGIELRNPIITSASSLGNHVDKLRRLEEAGAGAVTTKLISSAVQPPEHDFPYRMVYYPSGWLLAGEENLSMPYGVDMIRVAKRELSIPVIANFVGVAGDVDTWVADALTLQAAGADALEMDLYCPMSGLGTDIDDHPDGGHGYLSICAFPEALAEVTRALVSAVDIPVIPKMHPMVTSVTGTAQTLVDAGARTIVMSNCMAGNPGVDIYNGGRSKLPHAKKILHMPQLGRYLFTIQSRLLAMLKTELDESVQFATGGGVYDWEDIVQRIMLGGHAVQLCSTIFENGPRVIGRSLDAMTLFMDEHGYADLAQMRGISLATIGKRAEASIEPAVARVVEPLALVGRGEEIVDKVRGDCLAMTLGDHGTPRIDESLCTGCGWCVHHAGDGSIELVPTQEFISDLGQVRVPH